MQWENTTNHMAKNRSDIYVNEYGYHEQIFNVLIDLYNNHDVMNDLSQCRINPNFNP